MTTESPDTPTLPEGSPFLRNAAIAGAVITPLVMLLPPRKMDLRFFVLASTFSLSTDHLANVYTGQSIYSRFQNRIGSLFDMGLPDEAKKTQQLIREHREREAALKNTLYEDKRAGGLAKAVEDVWMGGEGKDWQKKRAEEHQKSLEEGKGLGGIIMDQISDVWNGNWKPGSTKPDDEAGDDKPSDKK